MNATNQYALGTPENGRNIRPINVDQNRREGERRKDAAMVLLEARRSNSLRQARRAMLESLLKNGVATADDVRARVELPEGLNPKLFGAVPGVLARAGIIRRSGFARTVRPDAHARPISIWRLVDAAKAELWLASHRPLPDLTTAAELLQQIEETPTAPFGEVATADASTNSTPITKTRKESNHG